MTKSSRPTLIATAGGRGGPGKTTASVILADYFATRGIKQTLIDCDTENAGTPACFSHWLEGKVNNLDLRNPKDRDRLLTDSAECGSQFVVADLPANATGDIYRWLQEVATVELIRELGLTIIAVGLVPPGHGGARSVVKWITTLGNRASFLVVLNRIDYEIAPRPTKEVFSDWFDNAVPSLVPKVVSADRLHVIEFPNMEKHGMDAMVALGRLPSKAMAKDSPLNLLDKQRIKNWRDSIYAQLDSTGLFAPKEASVPA